MAKRSSPLSPQVRFSHNSGRAIKGQTLILWLLALAACWRLAGGAVQAANLLINPSFESPPSGQKVPTGWKYFAQPTLSTNVHDYWIETGPRAHTGSFYWKEWDAVNNSSVTDVAGIYQDFSTAAGSTYQASGWFQSSSSDAGGMGADCRVWIEVSFLNAATNVLALYKSSDYSASEGLDTWFQHQVTNTCDLSSPLPGGDPYFPTYAVTGSVSQIVAPVGSTIVRYRFAYSQAGIHGSGFFDDAILNQISGPIPPVINNVFPLNMIFVNPNDGFTFNVSSPSGFTINSSGIGLVINGSNVSAGLVITGSSSNKNVAYHGLQSNLVCNASITVTDVFNLSASSSTYFETTWVGIPPIRYLWEAEDFDFSSGGYINNPVLCNSAGNPNCYFGKVGVEGVDEHNSSVAPTYAYRPDDVKGTQSSGDYSRKDHALAGVLDYRIDPFNTAEWLNYTRDWTNSTNWIVGRLSTDVGLSGSLILSQVNPDTSTTDLGTFSIANGRGWSAFDNVFLKDTNGNIANVVLNGKSTLRLTSVGNLLPNFFMLVPAQVDLPFLSNLYPAGAHPFEFTNALSFTATTVGSTFPANGITVNLDGNNVTANLVITGSSSVKNVVYPTLRPNSIHVAIITATNSLGHGIRVTNNFDTFNEANYMVELEDFDYNGGNYIDPWTPDAYADYNGPYPATSGEDFQHISLTGEQFQYRSSGIPQESLGPHDYLRTAFVNFGAVDYVLTFFAGTDWANYTRAYPAGSYYVYGRFSGGGPFTMHLDQVISGAGTASQTTRRLGHWNAVGQDYITYAWVPLTDDGFAAPTVVRLNGVSTLRVTTDGFCNPNYVMLVPASGIQVTVARSGANIALSFPTVAGATYQVFYRTNLTTANWTLWTSVFGDGTVKSVNEPATATQRFYKVVAP
jgi:hypothetical protein